MPESDIYLTRFRDWHYDVSGIQRMTSRRSGPHANLVAKLRRDTHEFIAKVPAFKGSRHATRAIQKEYRTLSHLQSFDWAKHIPTPIQSHMRHHDCAAEYQVCPGVPMNLFMARHITEPVWQQIMNWTCQFLIHLGKSTPNGPEMTPNDCHGLLIRRPLSIIQQVYGTEALEIQAYAESLLASGNLPYRFIPVHGDFNPWNMLIVPSPSLSDLHPYVLDWEDYSPFGLPLFDGFYFLMVCIWILAFGETKSNNLAQIEIDELIQRNHLITKLAKNFCLTYGQSMQLNSHMIDPLFVLFLIRATAEDIRTKRANPRSATRWWDILKFQLKDNIFLNAVKLMFLYSLRSKGQLTQNARIFNDAEAEIQRILSRAC